MRVAHSDSGPVAVAGYSNPDAPRRRPAAPPGPVVIRYRASLNTDPPALADIWNASATGRGAYPIRTPAHFERWLFSKPYFRRDDITVAVDDDNRPVGFALAGFAPNQELTALDLSSGVVCAVLVRPEFRRQGVGRELFRRADDTLRGRGATRVVFGSQWPACPYLFGLYGGSNVPGILMSEPDAAPFLDALGAKPLEQVLVFQKKLDTPLTLADARFAHLRRRYEVQTLRLAGIATWWHECVYGQLEPVELRLSDKLTGYPAARSVVWELEGFSWRWNQPAAGLLDLQVRDDLRRQGLGKLLAAQAMRFVQDQFFAVLEMQVPAAESALVALCQSLGCEQVDEGWTYHIGPPPPPTEVN